MAIVTKLRGLHYKQFRGCLKSELFSLDQTGGYSLLSLDFSEGEKSKHKHKFYTRERGVFSAANNENLGQIDHYFWSILLVNMKQTCGMDGKSFSIKTSTSRNCGGVAPSFSIPSHAFLPLNYG